MGRRVSRLRQVTDIEHLTSLLRRAARASQVGARDGRPMNASGVRKAMEDAPVELRASTVLTIVEILEGHVAPLGSPLSDGFADVRAAVEALAQRDTGASQ